MPKDSFMVILRITPSTVHWVKSNSKTTENAITLFWEKQQPTVYENLITIDFLLLFLFLTVNPGQTFIWQPYVL